jgi:hypothetical protein
MGSPGEIVFVALAGVEFRRLGGIDGLAGTGGGAKRENHFCQGIVGQGVVG